MNDAHEIRVRFSVGEPRAGAKKVVDQAKREATQIAKAQEKIERESSRRTLGLRLKAWKEEQAEKKKMAKEAERAEGESVKRTMAIRRRLHVQEQRDKKKEIDALAKMEQQSTRQTLALNQRLYTQQQKDRAKIEKQFATRSLIGTSHQPLAGGIGLYSASAQRQRAAYQAQQLPGYVSPEQRAAARREQFSRMVATPTSANSSPWSPLIGAQQQNLAGTAKSFPVVRGIMGAAVGKSLDFISKLIPFGAGAITGYVGTQIAGGVSRNRSYRASLAQLRGMNYGGGLEARAGYLGNAARLGANPEEFVAARAATGRSVGDATGGAGLSVLAAEINSAGTLTAGRQASIYSSMRSLGIGGKTGAGARIAVQSELSKLFGVAIASGVKDAGRRADFAENMLGLITGLRGRTMGGAGQLFSNVSRGVTAFTSRGGALREQFGLDAYQRMDAAISGADPYSKEAAWYRMVMSGYGVPGSTVSYGQAEKVRRRGLAGDPGAAGKINATLAAAIPDRDLRDVIMADLFNLQIGQAEGAGGITGAGPGGKGTGLYSIKKARGKVPGLVSQQISSNVQIMQATESLTDAMTDLQRTIRKLLDNNLDDAVEWFREMFGAKSARAKTPRDLEKEDYLQNRFGKDVPAVSPWHKTLLSAKQYRDLKNASTNPAANESQRAQAREEAAAQERHTAGQMEKDLAAQGATPESITKAKAHFAKTKDVAGALEAAGAIIKSTGEVIRGYLNPPESKSRGGGK